MNDNSGRTDPGPLGLLIALIALLIRSFGLFLVGILIGILVVVLGGFALWLVVSMLRTAG